VCGQESRRFAAFGRPRREEARCGWCSSLERHRLVWLYLEQRSGLFDGAERRVLHVAPEPCLEAQLRARLGKGYVTADFSNPDADVRMDITAIQYPEQTFDFIYCSHVLEHVTDDRQAMREFHRVLRRDGTAVLLVPIALDQPKTFEDPNVSDPRERERLFGQRDHVRRYGRDYVDRLREAGFSVEVLTANDLTTAQNIDRMRLTEAAGQIHVCRRVGG
jgi:SAM-dependent methyltransferase